MGLRSGKKDIKVKKEEKREDNQLIKAGKVRFGMK